MAAASPLTIRRAAPADAAPAAGVVAASIRALCPADHHDDPDILMRWLADKTAAAFAARIGDGARLWLACEGAAILGVGETEIAPHPAPLGRISLNYVAPGHQRRGISRALLAAMETDLAAHGRTEASLTATATARDFYLAQGWQIAAPPRQGRWIIGHPMRKTLAPHT